MGKCQYTDNCNNIGSIFFSVCGFHWDNECQNCHENKLNLYITCCKRWYVCDSCCNSLKGITGTPRCKDCENL